VLLAMVSDQRTDAAPDAFGGLRSPNPGLELHRKAAHRFVKAMREARMGNALIEPSPAPLRDGAGNVVGYTVLVDPDEVEEEDDVRDVFADGFEATGTLEEKETARHGRILIAYFTSVMTEPAPDREPRWAYGAQPSPFELEDSLARHIESKGVSHGGVAFRDGQLIVFHGACVMGPPPDDLAAAVPPSWQGVPTTFHVAGIMPQPRTAHRP
jgi:hypothetical protein